MLILVQSISRRMMKELVPDRKVIPGLEWMEEGVSPRLNPDSLVYVGLRDIDKVSLHIYLCARNLLVLRPFSHLNYVTFRPKENVFENLE